MKMNGTFNVYLISGLLTAGSVFASDTPDKRQTKIQEIRGGTGVTALKSSVSGKQA